MSHTVLAAMVLAAAPPQAEATVSPPAPAIEAAAAAAASVEAPVSVAPVAMGYKSAVPKPVRHGIRNFINNLDEPVVALAFLLQLKPDKAAETI